MSGTNSRNYKCVRYSGPIAPHSVSFSQWPESSKREQNGTICIKRDVHPTAGDRSSSASGISKGVTLAPFVLKLLAFV